MFLREITKFNAMHDENRRTERAKCDASNEINQACMEKETEENKRFKK